MYNSHNIVLGIIYENLSINGCIIKMWTMAIAINMRMQKRETLTRAHPVQKIKGRWWVLREGELALNEPPNCLFSLKPSALKSYTHKQPSQTKKAVFMYLYIHTPMHTYIYIYIYCNDIYYTPYRCENNGWERGTHTNSWKEETWETGYKKGKEESDVILF